jgi:3-oxoadipate enol-lactonase
VLGEVRLERLHAVGRELLEPRLREVVLDPVQHAWIVHAGIIGRTPDGHMSRSAHLGQARVPAMKVVMLHSALGDSRLWKRQVAALSGEHEVVTPDLPGWGETPLPTESFSFVDAVAEHLPAALVGNSFGGAVALRTALAKQELISRLVLIAPGLPTWDWSEEMRTYWAAEEAAWDAGDFDLATQVNLDFWVKPEHQDEVRPQQRRAIELQSAHEEPEVTWPEPAPLETLAIPTLVVVGDDDKADFRAIAKHLVEHVPGSELAVVAGAGHLVGVDRPDELNALLRSFLSD